MKNPPIVQITPPTGFKIGCCCNADELNMYQGYAYILGFEF